MFSDGPGVAANGATRSFANGKSPQTANGTRKTTAVALNGSSKPRLPDKYYGHDREEVTRLLIQALSDMGFQSAADNVSRDSGFELESPTVAAFRSAVLQGSWAEAEQLLSGATATDDQSAASGNGLVLANGADKKIMRFWIRQQKFLELLERRETNKALMVLRTELTPLHHDTQKLHFLSSLLMCRSYQEVMMRADWDGADGQSREILLSQLSRCISPSVMLPEHRLATLLHQVKASQISSCMWHSSAVSPTLYSDHSCDRRNFPTQVATELDEHAGEVWQVVFSHDGSKLASCGGDGHVYIWEVPSFRLLQDLHPHDQGVGNVSWSWDDSMVVTCCTDRHARLWDVSTGRLLQVLERFGEPVSSCVWMKDNRSFITGSLDKSHSLIQWNLSGDKIHDWNSSRRVEDLAVSPDGHWLVIKDDKTYIQVYNMATRQIKYEMDLDERLMSISISQDSAYLLANHKNGISQLISLAHREVVQTYTGHVGGDYMIRNTFGGADESFVISGSEDGSIHIWHKVTAQLIEKLNGHAPRTNSVSWCPTNPCLFASCGDDGKIKIWANNQTLEMINTLQRNAAIQD